VLLVWGRPEGAASKKKIVTGNGEHNHKQTPSKKGKFGLAKVRYESRGAGFPKRKDAVKMEIQHAEKSNIKDLP